MKFLKNIFKKKEVQPIEEPIQQVPSPLSKDQWVCNFCGGTIDCGERWSKFQGKYYHKQCFKKMKQGVSSGAL
jgi:hypothetical protein